MLAEKIKELDLEKEKGWIYFVEKKGKTLSVYKSKMNKGKDDGDLEKKEIKETDIKPDFDSYLYYIDKEGDLVRSGKKE
ncbi:MAG: hypothetical protein BTN85_0440 [Candidatus Methanohalarchaeum thermophilum]|uniref:DUF5050 domain-containing protein n=1 Tax=Methanohalarchaeum thermophilum TaxID=1903181 RepID=A0A1Q6DUH5_METT1|nr:MAG: hypothetical protein BTN85_0440 [Candidatus Methanohalarchaeum thermophilum]